MGRLLTLVADTRAAVGPPAGLTAPYALRPCRPDDVEALGRQYFDAYDPGVDSATPEEALAEMRATFDGEYGDLWPEASPVATYAGSVVGAVQTVYQAPWEDTPDGPFVIELFTARDHRRRGLGRALLTAAMATAARSGHRHIALRVDPDNSTAMALYTRTGFRTVVRSATAGDAPVIARLYVESWNSGFGSLTPPQVLDGRRIERWAAELAASRTRWWIAERGGRAVGFAGVGPSRDPVDPGLGELDTIAVDPSHWRTGVGRILMSVALQGLRLQGNRSAILWTVAGYERGLRFYESTGWSPDGGTRDGGRQLSFRREVCPLRATPADDPPKPIPVQEDVIDSAGRHVR